MAWPKGRFGPFAPHLVEGRTATLSALLPFVAGAANDWIEPKRTDAALRSNGSNAAALRTFGECAQRVPLTQPV
jgi:hypothetical protein